MAKKLLRDLADVQTWRLENGDAHIDLERDTGYIRSMFFKAGKVDLFAQTRGNIPGYIGGIRIYDEHDQKWYEDMKTPFTISGASKRGNTVKFTKKYKGCPFTVTEIIQMTADGLSWEVQAVKAAAKVADRSLRVYYHLPLIAGWDIWAPCKFGQKAFDGMTPFEFMYTQIPYVSDQEVILPMVSTFSSKLNVGYSVIEPIDENVPAAKFFFNNGEKCFNWGSMHQRPENVPVLETVNYYIGLVGKRTMKTRIHVLFHAGDWRCGLGKVYKKYQEFFDPFNDAIYDREGSFLCGTVYNSDEVDKLVAMGLKTFEVHGHFQEYSDYFNDGNDRWLRVKENIYWKLLEGKKHAGDASGVTADEVQAYTDTHTPEQIAALVGVKDVNEIWHYREDIQRRLKIFADKGISPHWYFNYTDGFRATVEKRWPDSICKDEDGKPIPSGWYMCHNMNADPKYSFGKFTYQSAKKIFETYPTLQGFFLDCFRHYEIDFAHDDGVTVVNGRPAYSVNHSYDDIERKIKTEIMRPRNLTSFANKPMSIRSMRYCDGQLLEGDGDMYEEKFCWASIASPMFYMFFDKTVSVDEFMRRCLVHGCYPTLVERTDEHIALYQRYLPLFAQFSRRVLCFEADPMRMPKGARGKLFTIVDGYIAGLMNTTIDEGDVVKYHKTPYVLFRVQRGADVGKVGVMYAGDKEFRPVEFKFDGTFIAVPLKDYINHAVVKLFVTGKSGKSIGGDTFYSRPSICGDPDSAFEDISWR